MGRGVGRGKWAIEPKLACAGSRISLNKDEDCGRRDGNGVEGGSVVVYESRLLEWPDFW